jgi:hypothetical protein
MRKLNNNKEVSIVTVTLECEGGEASENNCRYEILKKVVAKYGKKDIILFSGGFFTVSALGSDEETKVVNDIHQLLTDMNLDTTVCLGIDIGKGKDKDKLSDKENAEHKDQIAIAIDKSGIRAKGRKFYPAPNIKGGKGKIREKGKIKLAESFNCKESGYDRIFECKGKRFYLAVCYDIFGIRHKKIAKPETDAILNTVHYFNPSGQKGCGYVFYVRYGFGGGSLHWDCPVFGAAVFFERKVPDTWQPAFLCKDKKQNLKSIEYADNLWVHDNKPDCIIPTDSETAFCYLYTI